MDLHIQKILENRYFSKDLNETTFEQLCRRVAKHVASAEQTPELREKYEIEFYELLLSRKFSPNTPTWVNAGLKGKRSLSACFVRDIDDTMEDILSASYWSGMVQKFGGGVGFSLSDLRPRNTKITSTHGKACGPIAVLKYLAATSQMITQGGVRQGANMAVLDINHPDIIDFINVKSNENKHLLQAAYDYAQTKINKGEWTKEQGDEHIEYVRNAGLFQLFNVSVAADNKFMIAVEKYEEYKKSLSVTENPPWSEKLPCGKTIAEVWDLIVEQAWSSGDPGLLFIDRMRAYGAQQSPYKLNATNPCITADQWVLTANGAKKVQDLINTPFEAIVDGQIYPSTQNGFFHTGKKDIYLVETKEGFSYKATGYHPVKVVDKGWVETINLQQNDKIVLMNHGNVSFSGVNGFTWEDGYLVGHLIGDGIIHKSTEKAIWSVWGNTNGAKSVKTIIENIIKKHKHRADFIGFNAIRGRTEYRLVSKAINPILDKLNIFNGHKIITDEIEYESSDFQKGVLSGLFDADGSIADVEKRRAWIQLSQSDKDLLVRVQRMLLRFGIPSRIYQIRRSGNRLMPDGKGGTKLYHCKKTYDLRISRDAMIWFRDRIGFRDIDKQNKLIASINSYKNKYSSNFYCRVEKITKLSAEEVYDCTIPNIGAFDLSGLFSSNCGEQALPSHGSCNLGSIDISKFDLPNISAWEEFSRVINLSVRFLDNVVEVNKFAMPEIEKVNKEERRIGLGVMGVADLLVKSKLSYGSQEALDLLNHIAAGFKKYAHWASKKLAEEKGLFPLFSQVTNVTLDKKQINSQVENSGMGLPFTNARRNATVTTIAPTGTISLVAGCSSGIEPHFDIGYFHHGMREHGGLGFIWASEIIKEIVTNHWNGKYTIEQINSPTQEMIDEAKKYLKNEYKLQCANEISVDWHIQHQALWQMYIDNSISKTINLPNSATREDVARAYLQAYIQGCKGTTIYRDGCKPFQVLNSSTPKVKIEKVSEARINDEKPIQAKHVEAPSRVYAPRPRKVPGETYEIQTAEGSLFITISYDERLMPFELFARMGKVGSHTTGYLDAIAQLISLSLRSGIHPYHVIKKLRGIKTEPFGFGDEKVLSTPDAIAQTLERFMIENHGENWATEFGWNGNGNNGKKVDMNAPRQLNLPISYSSACPKCGCDMIKESGCDTCHTCGYSKCG